LGLKAGKLLRKIHSIPAPKSIQDGNVQFSRRLKKELNSYLSKPELHCDIGDIVIKYFNESRGSQNTRPQTFVHGDYNPGNLIIMPNGEVGVIDFFSGYGDPYWEIYKVSWRPDMFPYFYSGQIWGYFNGEPPLDFWRAYTHNFAVGALIALQAPRGAGFNSLGEGKAVAQNILAWSDNFNNPVPSWYVANIFNRPTINGCEYDFVKNPIKNNAYRESYFKLIKNVFGLDFIPWYESGFCGDSFIPYTLFSNGNAIASAGVVINNFDFNGTLKKYVQISTVVTSSDYRNRGLSKWLIETILTEWRDNSDCIYLYANDSVTSFYSKLGFVPASEYRYHMLLSKKSEACRKLDLLSKNDVRLLTEMYIKSNPYSLISTNKGIELMMFHCTSFLHDNIYYIPRYDAVVIAEHKRNNLFCYDIYGGGNCDISDLLGIVAQDNTTGAILGFTPKDASGFIITQANEKNTTVFVLEGKENPFADNKITLPFLSRA